VDAAGNVDVNLTPLTEATELLTPQSETPETLTPRAEVTETLTLMGEIIRSTEFLHAGPNTYPSATTWPGLYGQITGHAFGLLNETTEVLTPLVEV
jgi:hypothetical protein